MRSLPILSRACALILAALLLSAQTPRPADTRPAATTAPAPQPDPKEYAARRAKLQDADVEGHLALARWARDHAMWNEAADMAQVAIFQDPGNRAAYLILQQVDQARPLPDEPDIENSLKTEFNKRFAHEFKTRTSRHFLFCYDTTDIFALQRAAGMEKVYDAFQFYFSMNALHPAFLDHRMVVILFKDREDYLSYITQTEHVDLSWSSGFYSQRSNRSAFFDDSSGATADSFKKQAAALKTEMDDLTQQISAANAKNDRLLVNQLNVQRSRDGEALAQITNRVGNTVAMLNNTKTLHEAAHQVAFNVGIQKRLVDYPLWFSEGLACSFETEDALGRRGPALLNYGRIGVIKQALKADKLLTIEQLIQQSIPAKTDNDTMRLVYSQGWALFHYLYKFDRAGMEKYLVAYNAHAQIRAIDDDERRKMFTNAFGADLDALNKKFVTYLRSLPGAPPAQ